MSDRVSSDKCCVVECFIARPIQSYWMRSTSVKFQVFCTQCLTETALIEHKTTALKTTESRAALKIIELFSSYLTSDRSKTETALATRSSVPRSPREARPALPSSAPLCADRFGRTLPRRGCHNARHRPRRHARNVAHRVGMSHSAEKGRRTGRPARLRPRRSVVGRGVTQTMGTVGCTLQF